MKWELLNLSSPGVLDELTALAGRASRESAVGGRAFDLDWRCGPDRDTSSLRAFVLRDASRSLGLALFSVRRQPLKVRLGEITLADIDLQRHWHLGDPFIDAALGRDDAVRACGLLLDEAMPRLRGSECLFLEGMPVEGALRAALLSLERAPAVRLPLGEEFDHQFIRMPETFPEYVAQLGSRSKQSVLYSQRRLKRDMDGDVRCECFETEESVERFVKDAVEVSRKTYQWNLLGLGLRDAEGLRRTLGNSARRGWFRSFILYCKGVPVAFMLGAQHGDGYYYDDVGYDPAYAKWSVGSVLQIEVLEFLLGRDDKPKVFDFSTGYGEHKGRFGNFSRRECNVLVLPASVRGRAVASAHLCADWASRTASTFLARAGIKDKVKRLIRRRSSRRAADA